MSHVGVTTNIPQPPRIIDSIAVAAEYLWQLYRALALEPTIIAGKVDVAGLATQAEVTLPIEQPHTDYHVVLTRVAKTGAPAAGSDLIDTVTKEKGKFVVNVQAAPGAGASNTFDWILRR